MSTLSFDVEIAHNQTDSWNEIKPYRWAMVQPVVDGKRLSDKHVFDAAVVLAHGDQPCETNLFTCTCGHAGCSGIHDHVKLTVQKGEMHWTFPEEPFRAEFDPDRFPADKPLTVKFKLSQYRKALADLEARLINLEAKGDHPLIICPGTGSPAHGDLTIKGALKELRAWVQQKREYEEKLCERLGQYRHAQLRITPNGQSNATATIWVTSLLAEAGWIVDPDDTGRRDDYFDNELLPAWHAGGESAVVATLLAMVWAEVEYAVWYLTDGNENMTHDDLCQQLEAAWPHNLKVELHVPGN